MIITQTPLRVSFLGGGTDYPEYFEKHGGAVLGTAIDKYVYFAATRFHSELFEYSIRLSYRQQECVNSLAEVQHAPFRECLRWCGVERDIEVNFSAELPALTGLGSSSSFVVGLLKTLNAYGGKFVAPLDLAYQAIKLERDVLHEAVGCQDQVFAAAGGFNVIEFVGVDDIRVERLPLSAERIREFEAHLLLFFTGLRRRASDMAKKQIARVDANRDALAAMRATVDEGYRILTSSGGLEEFGTLLDKMWQLKRTLSSDVSNTEIDSIYEAGRKAGALGGKLLGAGGGGFVLLFTPPEKKAAVRNALGHLMEIPIGINAPGSRIVHAA
jgi:D-glycero-alpha-D-manno-heptose-7-phosphate kinase